jgi:hypothetical protein
LFPQFYTLDKLGTSNECGCIVRVRHWNDGATVEVLEIITEIMCDKLLSHISGWTWVGGYGVSDYYIVILLTASAVYHEISRIGCFFKFLPYFSYNDPNFGFIIKLVEK